MWDQIDYWRFGRDYLSIRQHGFHFPTEWWFWGFGFVAAAFFFSWVTCKLWERK